jgi:hypothetical protein
MAQQRFGTVIQKRGLKVTTWISSDRRFYFNGRRYNFCNYFAAENWQTKWRLKNMALFG